MLLIVAVTCVDVVGAKVFRWRLAGAIDLVMLSQLVVVAFAAGMTLIKDRRTGSQGLESSSWESQE